MSNIERNGVFVFVCCVCVALGVLVGAQLSPKVQHSPEQSVEDINRQYRECMENAPEGFDCAATFMMVSDGYMQEIKAWSVE